MPSETFRPTARTTVKRLPERATYDRRVIHAILDEATVCHVGIALEGQPYVVPMAYARRGDALLLHGSAASRLMRTLAGGARACVTVTLEDGLVLARSAFNHSMNYRSVMALGTARPIENPDAKRSAFHALVEHLVPGRSRDARAPDDREMSATVILEMTLEEVSAKVRTGPPEDEDQDLKVPAWAGVVPFRRQVLPPEPAPDLDPAIEPPAYVTRYRRPGGDGA
jgi:hypothetical protein